MRGVVVSLIVVISQMYVSVVSIDASDAIQIAHAEKTQVLTESEMIAIRGGTFTCGACVPYYATAYECGTFWNINEPCGYNPDDQTSGNDICIKNMISTYHCSGTGYDWCWVYEAAPDPLVVQHIWDDGFSDCDADENDTQVHDSTIATLNLSESCACTCNRQLNLTAACMVAECGGAPEDRYTGYQHIIWRCKACP